MKFAQQISPRNMYDKLDANFTESVALEEVGNRKVSEESKYFSN